MPILGMVGAPAVPANRVPSFGVTSQASPSSATCATSRSTTKVSRGSSKVVAEGEEGGRRSTVMPAHIPTARTLARRACLPGKKGTDGGSEVGRRLRDRVKREGPGMAVWARIGEGMKVCLFVYLLLQSRPSSFCVYGVCICMFVRCFCALAVKTVLHVSGGDGGFRQGQT